MLRKAPHCEGVIKLKIYRYHGAAYLLATGIGLAVAALMRLSSSFDWRVDDGAVYLELVFGISGATICVMLMPVAWWLERQPVLTKSVRIGRAVVNALTLVPYALIAGILLFYRE